MAVTPRSREVRFGIVMYGGVSLAIYINGVSQELFAAVQGRGLYRLLKGCLDIDIIVDIISGTSAGGINGLLLGYALANGKDFSTTKELWRRDGDIGQLLNAADAKPESCSSLLNSDGFYRKQLAQAFKDLDDKDFEEPGCDLSRFDEMDVFITGTSFEPDVYTTFDDRGRALEMQDYRKVFKLKHRAARRNKGAFLVRGVSEEEKATRFEALAKLARITSCFPGAFLPVAVLQAPEWARLGDAERKRVLPYKREEDSHRNVFEESVDATLSEWGALKSSAYFLDGGVLDNKPFTPTVQAIFGRTADRPVDRMLFYVEPDPEVAHRQKGLPEQPDFLSAVRNGVISISTYQSTTDDARELEEHNSQVVRHTAVCDELKNKLGGFQASGVGIPVGLAEPQRSLYISTRNTSIASRAMRGILRDNETGNDYHMTSSAARENVRQLFRSLNKERKPGELMYEETFEYYDIYFRQRRLHHTIKWTFLYLSQLALDSPERDKARQILQGLNGHVQMLEIVQHWLEYAMDRAPVDWDKAWTTTDRWDDIWGQVSAYLKAFLSVRHADTAAWLPTSKPGSAAWLSTGELDVINDGLKSRVAALLDPAQQPMMKTAAAQKDFRGLLQWTDECERALFDALVDTSALFTKARAEYDEFARLDAIVFPLDYLSNLQSLNEVKLLRISPSPTLNDEIGGGIGFKGEAGAEQKLAGRLLGHFSGFLKRSWRSNDILWGRLDGLRHIVLALLNRDTVERFANDRALRERVLASLGGPAGLAAEIGEVFPQSPPISHGQLAVFFEMLLATPQMIDDASLERAVNLLVEMGQLEIIHEEIGTILRDAGEQQRQWNRYRTASAQAAPPPVPARAGRAKRAKRRGGNFTSPAGWIDPAVIGLHIDTELAAAEARWAHGIATAQGPKDTALGRYFERDFDVAGEKLERGMPPLVLAEHIGRVLLVLNACLLGSLPESVRHKIAANRLLKLSLRQPLRLGYRLVTLWLREPKMTAITLSTAFAASLAGLAMVVYFYVFAWLARHSHSDMPGFTTALLLAGIPALVLVVSSLLLLRRTRLGL